MSEMELEPRIDHAPPKRRFEMVLMFVVGTAIFLMMAITFVDVVGRYAFNAPIPGGFELIEFLMPLSIFSGLPIITRRRTHIIVSILDGWFRGRVGDVRRLVVDAGSLAVVGFIAERLWSQGVGLAEAQIESGYLEWPVAPVAYAISVLSLLTCFVLVLMVKQDLTTIFGKPA